MDEIDNMMLEDLKDPCGNCEEHVKQCDVELEQFLVNLKI